MNTDIQIIFPRDPQAVPVKDMVRRRDRFALANMVAAALGFFAPLALHALIGLDEISSNVFYGLCAYYALIGMAFVYLPRIVVDVASSRRVSVSKAYFTVMRRGDILAQLILVPVATFLAASLAHPALVSSSERLPSTGSAVAGIAATSVGFYVIEKLTAFMGRDIETLRPGVYGSTDYDASRPWILSAAKDVSRNLTSVIVLPAASIVLVVGGILSAVPIVTGIDGSVLGTALLVMINLMLAFGLVMIAKAVASAVKALAMIVGFLIEDARERAASEKVSLRV